MLQPCLSLLVAQAEQLVLHRLQSCQHLFLASLEQYVCGFCLERADTFVRFLRKP